jgi:glutamine cyclotransferase
MRTDSSKYIIFLTVTLFLTWTISCSGRPGKKTLAESAPALTSGEEISVKLIKMISPDENTGFKLHDQIKMVLAPEDNNKFPDSVMIFFDGKSVKTLKSEPWEYTVPSVFTGTTGRKSLKVVAYKGGRSQNTITRFMVIYSDVVPKKYGYKVIHSFPHDRDAFTQGLFYDRGVLFEGTGQENESSLREVELESGKVLRQLNLGSSLFGEGITLYKDKIFQVTWRSKVGFVYEKATYNLINKIYYQTEGWGLTTINDQIVMSDGTNIIYYYEPETFTVVSRIEIYDNREKVDSLNELEYINGEIWANIWMSDRIARIDPASGKVLGYIDLKGILNDPDTDTKEKVLNGIAFDKDRNRIFVTGKNWPKLFEITVTQ